jgi:hypothetical protein
LIIKEDKNERLLLSLIIALTVLATLPIGAFAAENKSDQQLAQERAKEFIASNAANINTDWEGADPVNGTPCFDLQARLVGYVFEIVKTGKPAGYIVVGSALYRHDVLETVGGGFSPLQSEDEAKAALGVNKAIDSSKLMLVYLGYRQYYYVSGTGKGALAFSVQSKSTVKRSELVSSLATPEQYKQNCADMEREVLVTFTNPLPVPEYTMYGASPYPNDCGPTSGAMISQYWKTWRPNLPFWPTNHHELYVTMYCNNWAPLSAGTAPWNFGPGWLQYASNHGYTGYTTDWAVNRAFSVIQAEINAGRPTGVMFSYNQSYTNWHWCVVKGYVTSSGNILMNDPWGLSHFRQLGSCKANVCNHKNSEYQLAFSPILKRQATVANIKNGCLL